MPPPYNTFDSAVEKACVRLIKASCGSLCENIVGSDNTDPDVLPRVIVSTEDMEEIIYQTGNYRGRVEITIKTNIGNQTSEDSETLFASVLDVFQQVDFNNQMTATGLMVCQGSIIQQLTPSGTEDQMWTKKFDVDIFGLSYGG